ncbi:unnamed protein product, partial [Mesorhabditis belari]|uniref:Protein kinase domain-containing protein n=1 Tax=Mesorhabditis belari TaxID=2138241 RepID=A0AAF3ETE0_9BILA
MCAEESTVIGSGAFGFVVVFGENTKKAAKKLELFIEILNRANPNSLTTTITLAGTFRYMSPEAYGYPNQRLITSSTDLYSIGLVIWEIVERRLVHSDYSTSKIFKEYDFFYDLWHGKYSLEEIKCTDRKLKDLVIRCTNIHPGKRPNLDECAQSIEWLIEQAKDDPVEPLLVETQNVLIRPIGFDGTKQWVPAVDRTVFDSLSFNLKSTKTPTKSKTLSKRRQMIEVTLAKGNNSSNNSRPMIEEERFLVNDGSEHESRKVNKRMLCLFLWMLLSCITFALLMFIWNFVASGDLRNSFPNQSISQNAINDSIFTKWTTNNQTLISAVDLTIGYKLLKALSDIKLALPEHEINAIIRPEYLFDLDEKPYANGQQNSFVVYQPTNGTLDEKLSGLLREFDLLYVDAQTTSYSQSYNQMFNSYSYNFQLMTMKKCSQ